MGFKKISQQCGSGRHDSCDRKTEHEARGYEQPDIVGPETIGPKNGEDEKAAGEHAATPQMIQKIAGQQSSCSNRQSRSRQHQTAQDINLGNRAGNYSELKFWSFE